MEYYAGLDVGGTSGRVKFLDSQGKEIGSYLGMGCAFNTEGPVLGRQKYGALMTQALAQYSLRSEDCLGICVAASGIDSPALADSCREIFMDMGFQRERLLVVNDCELFLYLSEGPALVVISGTGSICFGRDTKGQIFRTGGWNHVLSDEGSSYDIGLQTLKAAADSMDGRIPETILTKLVREQTGIASLEAADRFVNEHLMDKYTIGRLAALCADAAEKGDAQALRIIGECADKVYRLVEDTWHKMDMESAKEADLWLWGSVAVKNRQFQARLIERVHAGLPALSVGVPDRSALDTAAQTAYRFTQKD